MTANLNIPSDLDRIFWLSEIRTFRLAGGPPYALVVHNPEMKLISDLWLGGFETQDRFRDVLEFIAACFESGGYSLWLADLRFLSTGFSPSGDWLVKTLMPRVAAAGLEREAVILREDSGVPEGFDVFGRFRRAGTAGTDCGRPGARLYRDRRGATLVATRRPARRRLSDPTPLRLFFLPPPSRRCATG